MSLVPIHHDALVVRLIQRMPTVVLLFIGLMGFALLTPNRADATCGDYLGQHPIASQDTSDDNRPLTPAPHQQRCHGPACRQGQMPPSSPIPSVESQIRDQWAWIAADYLRSDQHAAQQRQSNELPLLPVVVDRLDRPPR